MYRGNPTYPHNRVGGIVRTGTAGCMSVCLMAFGGVLLVPGFIMTGVAFGDSTWEDSFFNSMRVYVITDMF